MTDDSARPTGPEDFIAELNAFYESCNRPPYRKLAETSEHLGELYGRRGLPVLSATAVFEVLAGRRKRVPTSAWVASFILCCQRRAWETGVRSSDPGISTLPHWQSRLRAAQGPPSAPPSAPPPDATETGGPPGLIPEPRVAGTVPAPEAPRGRDFDRAADGPGAPGATVPVRLTVSQRAAVADYGEHGRELVERAAEGDADAVYRVAVLIGTDSTRGPEAVALLIEAAAGEHPQALDLLDASPNGLDHHQAAQHAFRLGEAAAGAGAPATALAYYKAAVGGGLLDAAFKITEILQGTGAALADPSWFAPAGGPEGA
ncbi:hypothetical protein AGRA3207_007053 [Actinomadura graeca]|uniref:Sel1 repeat family protein n=1 Tax=Actinomadura graeca TaxID=2750812 RepID=A0ABX8R3W9_9ACTN|nr:hypothetical protein [Actinomadura graeca]QXJ25543.1 hypothetical protein AGRA3207_007053 [Actinomadura graeca]